MDNSLITRDMVMGLCFMIIIDYTKEAGNVIISMEEGMKDLWIRRFIRESTRMANLKE